MNKDRKHVGTTKTFILTDMLLITTLHNLLITNISKTSASGEFGA